MNNKEDKLKEEFMYMFEGSNITISSEMAKSIWDWINSNYISRDKILNLECLKEENESGWKGNSFDNTGTGNKSVRNQLRKEIIDEINKL